MHINDARSTRTTRVAHETRDARPECSVSHPRTKRQAEPKSGSIMLSDNDAGRRGCRCALDFRARARDIKSAFGYAHTNYHKRSTTHYTACIAWVFTHILGQCYVCKTTIIQCSIASAVTAANQRDAAWTQHTLDVRTTTVRMRNVWKGMLAALFHVCGMQNTRFTCSFLDLPVSQVAWMKVNA